MSRVNGGSDASRQTGGPSSTADDGSAGAALDVAGPNTVVSAPISSAVRGDITSEVAVFTPLNPPPETPSLLAARTKPISTDTAAVRGRPHLLGSVDDVVHLASDPAPTGVMPMVGELTALAPVPMPRIRVTPDADELIPPPVVYSEPEPEPDEESALRRVVRLSPAGRRTRRPRIRRVTRVVRHVDPWSVFKVALCFSMVLYGVCLTAGVLLWNVAYTTGTIDNVQRFFESFGWNSFKFKGGQLFHNAWIAGLFAAIGLTGLIVLAATLFNLITDLVGGIRVTVLEEEVVERNPTAARQLLRRRSTEMFRIQGRRPHGPGHSDDDDDGDLGSAQFS